MLVKKSMGSCGARGEWPWREDDNKASSKFVRVREIKVKGVRVKVKVVGNLLMGTESVG
jgi:hypothetical protein